MESDNKNVSMSVIRRLPRYYRYLTDLERKGKKKISSQELAILMGTTASQVRQDLNAFGINGRQGYGYEVSDLRAVTKDLIGLNSSYHCIIIGAGHMGQAIAGYGRYRDKGILVKAMFDVAPENVVDSGDSEIYHIDQLEPYLKENHIDICILTVPKEEGQKMAERVAAAGVRGILNFVPVDLDLPEEVIVENVNITDTFYRLTYFLNHQEK